MAGLVNFAVRPKERCYKCEEMLHVRNLRQQKVALSASWQFVQTAAKVRLPLFGTRNTNGP